MNGQKNIRVLIAEDDYLVSEMIKALLEEMEYAIVGDAANGTEAIEMTHTLQPDVIMMDIEMPDMDGIEATRQIQERCPTPVVVLTAYEIEELVERASVAGVGAYLVKPPKAHEMRRAITIAMARFDDMKALRRMNIELQAEITQRKRAEEQAKTTLAEKETLLKEVYHRVKNNLYSLTHLIEMQVDAIEDPQILQVLGDLQGRVGAMGLVHEKLYRTRDLARIDFGEYLEDLTYRLAHALKGDRPISLRTDVANISLGANVAITCGLIVNELVTNALKYAFPSPSPRAEGRKGRDKARDEICVEFGAQGDEYVLTVSDNGVGLPPDLDWQTTESLGLKLINLWAIYQLRGTLDVNTRACPERGRSVPSRRAGTIFTIKFPK
ncbi:MAG: response regulator [Chloroflexi bacterium]|nr:response regulator [Chloroflexota bacterium]